MRYQFPARAAAPYATSIQAAKALLLAAALVVVASCSGGSDAATGPAADVAPASEEAPAGDTGSDASTSPAAAEADRAPTGAGGRGGGTVSVGDMAYLFTNEVCFASPNNLSLEGPASSNGEFGDAWVSIAADTNEDYDSDGVSDITAEVTIVHGKTDLFGDGDDALPDLFASRNSFSTRPEGINEGVLDFEIVGDTVAGSGEFSDSSGITIPFGETMQFTFEASCS